MKKTFKITGMHCASCSKLIEMELQNKVKEILIDFKTGKAEIEFDESQISTKQIIAIITGLGYKIN